VCGGPEGFIAKPDALTLASKRDEAAVREPSRLSPLEELPNEKKIYFGHGSSGTI
jgi:hypothetical protein